ncbi:DUF4304 domain-containing protein [Myroides odoratus]|uniref:DUF4304 domain-containing protein n=1 Tax=Myroides odoratus TaxID=256 RepID=A0A9Q6Z3G4_MYROD|nr:DUF4304 domain-containing protein [Myroides odoratus]EHQ43618.1 hypothetical protein Myrod_2797 [Myroides odoratus DSM 2801]EKB04388.1 hypothetical protein HMPREF9716_03300 [Myroides odoratus CIP 103059]QQU00938.1 DUF4304 domain-containing protein [Myroides odoratus]WQD56812.1 DUF4304 domain-containing protein [Myroides odoratus]STZ30895.1 Uncharacterised protein [Myroides odoratus]
MEKKELVSILNEVLAPIGFKKKGDYWVINGDEITKMINLQKSQFANSFYINYGYILKSVPLNGLMMHVFKGVGSTDKIEQQRITRLLDLSNNIPKEERANELKKLLYERLITNIQEVSTEEDVLNQLKKRPHLNDIPLVIKKYFNLLE